MGNVVTMLWMLLLLLLSLLLAGAVVIYVAFPRRGEDVPHAAWLGQAMKRGVAALPTLDNQHGHRDAARGVVSTRTGRRHEARSR